MKKVKWGVIGTAGIAKGATIPGMKQAANCELYAIAGRNLEKARAFKEEFGFKKAYGSYEEMLDDPKVEAVYIALPNDLHYEYVLKSINAGKHVLCEKPMVPTLKEAGELFDAAKEKGVFLMEAFAYLQSPYVAALKEEIDNKTIGDIVYIDSAFITQGYSGDNFRLHKAFFGGAMYDLGCYSISLSLWLLDKLPVDIKGFAEFTDEGIDYYSSALLIFNENQRASVNCGMILGTQGNCRHDRLYIQGTKGSIRSLVEFNQSGKLSYEVCVDGKVQKKTVKSLQNYRLEVEQFGSCILNGQTPLVSEKFSLMEAEVLEKTIEAIGYND